MHSAESPSLSEAYSENDAAPHDVRGERDPFPERIRMETADSNYDERLRWPRPDASSRGSAFQNNRSPTKKPSLGNRMAQATGRFIVAVLIGVGATLAWQSYGDEARVMLVNRAPSLAWLAPVSAAQSTTATPISSADLAQQLKPMALDIAILHHDLEQLAAKQEQFAAKQGQIAQGVSTMEAVEREISLRVAAMTPPKTVHPQPHPALQHPAQPAELSGRR
jgi:hypothetical protein